MAEILPTTDTAGPTTVEAFLADRQRFWSSFTGFITGGVIFVAALLILMAIFLL